MAHPPSSPRLPSPPPAAEIQISPNSPELSSGGSAGQSQREQQREQTVLDGNAKRRIHPGTRAADFAVGPPLVPLSELDSAFQLQEHLAALHYFHTASSTQPIGRATAHTLALAPPGTDRTLWLYELCRFLIAQCNGLLVGFLFDTPPCSAATCPEMRASEWQFLCAVHEQPKSCCAIDYCCHTLDWAANVVTNPKIFPSRFVFADTHDRSAAAKNLTNVFRRLHRIFAHAWFQHRGVFWSVEGQTGLYVLFKTVCDMYDLLPAENYKLPPEAEGLDGAASAPAAAAAAAAAADDPGLVPPCADNSSIPGLLSIAALADRKGPVSASAAARRSAPALVPLAAADDDRSQSAGRTSTRRHIRGSPSTGSFVTTVLEQDEEALSAAAASGNSSSSSSRNSGSGSGSGSSSLLVSAPSAMAAHVAAPPSITIREHIDGKPDGDVAQEPAASDVTVVGGDAADWPPAADADADADAGGDAAPRADPATSTGTSGEAEPEQEKETAPTSTAGAAGGAPEDEAAAAATQNAAVAAPDGAAAEAPLATEDSSTNADGADGAEDAKDAQSAKDAKDSAPSEAASEGSETETVTASDDASLASTSILDFAPTAEETAVTCDFAEKVATAPEEAVDDDVPGEAAAEAATAATEATEAE